FFDCTLGRITVNSIAGDVKFMDGEVTGLFKVKAMSGDIHVQEAEVAAMSFSTMSGDISVKNSNLNDDFTANTMSGDIEDDHNNARAGRVFRTMSGDLKGFGETRGVFSTMSGRDKFVARNG
ncbi:MAG: DUF4097 domain-containing protein, partial [Flavobacteriales bacterium]|nr:DUF4097 domain-containing protein [Flavobacteriales bacterium]